MTLYGSSLKFLLVFFPFDWSRSTSGCDRIIYNLNAPSPPTPSICLSTPALHQLSLSPPSLFFLPSPIFSFFFFLFPLFVSFFISQKLPHLFIFLLISSFSLISSQPWVVGVRSGIYGICSVTSSQTYRVLAD